MRGVKYISELVMKAGRTIIVTETNDANLVWADIPNGTLRINPTTGAMSQKIEGFETWQALTDLSQLSELSQHLSRTNNPHSVTKEQLGLGNVTNNASLKKITSSIDNQLIRWDGTTGDSVQGSQVVVDDTGKIDANGGMISRATITVTSGNVAVSAGNIAASGNVGGNKLVSQAGFDGEISTADSAIDIGKTGKSVAAESSLKLHSSTYGAGTSHYDVKIAATGGAATSGQGTLTIDAAAVNIAGTLAIGGKQVANALNKSISFTFGYPADNEKSHIYVCPAAMKIAKCEFRCQEAPSASTTFNLYKNGQSIYSFSTSAASYTSGTLDISLAAGDAIYVQIGASNSIGIASVQFAMEVGR